MSHETEAQRLADKYATDWMPVYEACTWPGCVDQRGWFGEVPPGSLLEKAIKHVINATLE